MPDERAILLIEDNPGDARLIKEMLEETRRSAVAAESDDAQQLRHAGRLADGLQHLRDGAFDVVLLDLGLPDSTGIATLETVRDHSPEIPIVVLTGVTDETVGNHAVQQGAQEYLVKDELTPPLLRRSLRHAIERTKFDRTRTALHNASREVIQAESKREVSRLTVDTAVGVLDLPGISIFLFDDSTNVLQPVAYTDYIEDLFGEVPVFGPDETSITWQAFVAGETITLDDVGESARVYRTDTPVQSGIWIPLGDHGMIILVSEESDGFDQQTLQLADHLAATAEAALDRVEREEALRDHERELARQNRQLEDMNRVNELIREIDQVLVRATTRGAIENAVCELVTRDERFAFAWIGEPVDDERLRPRTWAGADGGYLDSISLAIGIDDAPPAVTATATGTVALTPNVAADLRGAPWRQAALTRGFQSAISVPLAHNGMSYGVLTVFAAEPNAFDTRLKDVFEELGETIANALNAVETRRALLADTVVELELAIHESADLLSQLAREADCHIKYGGIVPQSDGTTRVFFTARGTSQNTIRDVAEGVSSVRRLECINRTGGDDSADGSRFEAMVTGSTIPLTLVECGAVVRSVEVTASTTRAVVELPDTTDVRAFIDRVDTTYPETELIARRDRERSGQSPERFETALTERLTDRQLETLHTAYLSGYFEWPRERTGEEVAESLGITQPTFNGHLRAAERKLCAMLFDESSPASDGPDQHM